MTLRSPRKRATWPATYRPAESVSGRRPERVRPPRVLAQFVSHSLPSGAVHHRPPRTHSRSSRTVPVPGARRSTVLESVLGASPREFESRILRQAPARRRASRVPRHKRQWKSGGTPGCPKGRTAVGHRCSRARRTIGPPRRPQAQTAPTARPPTSAQRRNPQPRRPNPRSPCGGGEEVPARRPVLTRAATTPHCRRDVTGSYRQPDRAYAQRALPLHFCW